MKNKAMRLTKIGATPFAEEEISTVSCEAISDLIDACDNLNQTGVWLETSTWRVFIFGGVEDRVIVRVHARQKSLADYQYGALIDPEQKDNQGELDISISGDVNPEPLYRTITREKAKEIACYVLEHDSFPPGLEWEGNMP